MPREGVPRALGHAIEAGPWRHWPAAWPRATYSSWRELESRSPSMVRGKRIAMEYSPGDAVPYLDRVPAGVLEMVRAAGATAVVSSGELVTRFYAVVDRRRSSRRTSARPRRSPPIARDAFALAGERARTREPVDGARADAVDSRAIRRARDSPPITGRACAPARTRRTRTTSRRPSAPRPIRRRRGAADRPLGDGAAAACTPTRRGWRSLGAPTGARAGGVDGRARRARRGDRARAERRGRRTRRCAAPTWTTRRAR